MKLGRPKTSRGLRLRTCWTLHLVLVCLSDIVYQLANWLIVNKYTEPGNLSAVLSVCGSAAVAAADTLLGFAPFLERNASQCIVYHCVIRGGRYTLCNVDE